MSHRLNTLQHARGRNSSWNLILDKHTHPQDSKTEYMKVHVDNYNKLKSIHEGVTTKYTPRWLTHLTQKHGTTHSRTLTLINTSRLILHLGRTSVLENVGIYTQHTTGLPIIPGTAVKGVLSTWIAWASADANGPLPVRRLDLARTILGDDYEKGSEQAGSLTFLGAFPTTPPTLTLDILTDHTANSPIPHTFLALEPGTTWHFPILAHPSLTTEEAKEALDTATHMLTQALSQLGIGAKTAAGYGKFTTPEQHTQQRHQTMTPEQIAKEKQQQQLNQEKLVQQAQLSADYDEQRFKAVLALIGNPGSWQVLQNEHIPKLKKTENKPWLDKFLTALKANKDKRKQMHTTGWFPEEWKTL